MAIVVNYNAGDLLGRCVEALLSDVVPERVLVIDNASEDDSAQALQSRPGRDPRLQLIFNADNTGFARAVNQGIREAGSDDVLVVNPDCLLQPGAAAQLVRALRTDSRAGLVAPLVTDIAGVPERSAVRRLPRTASSFFTITGLHRLQGRFPRLAGVSAAADDLPATATAVEAVSGACMLIRREALEETGGFDEAFAMHCEDLDLMARLAAAGWHCLIEPAARAVHHQGRSSRSRPLWVHYQKHRGMSRYYHKHEAARDGRVLQGMVELGIWLRFLALAPVVLLRR